MSEAATSTAALFISRWQNSGASERANYALFLSELCDLLQVPRPEPTRQEDAENAYVFERNVTFQNSDGSTSTGRIDLYKRACFVLEAKQGSDQAAEPDPLALNSTKAKRGTALRGTAGWDTAMLKAKSQAENYVRNLPGSEPNPPFLVVVDVGHTIELFSDFSGQGRTYVPFPDARSHRLKLADLTSEENQARLRSVWTDPHNLDPSRRSAKVTRSVAERLAKLAQSLEASGHEPASTAAFLMRCLFTFFAEDVGLLPNDCFTNLLKELHEARETSIFPEMVQSLWATMKTGGPSPLLKRNILRFNGNLFESPAALPVTASQLALLIEAGKHDWREVEPAIFGTLLERALNPIERHKLGAHYTPRAYVERLVFPTMIEPLRAQWANVFAAAVTEARAGKMKEARELVNEFLDMLCGLTILDPACGTGNFLYVCLDHLKRLEGEVWDALRQFGETQEVLPGLGQDIDPHQFRGIEINPRAAAIADLVLWIGYLQWNLKTFGRAPSEPIIHAYHNIECRDAVLAYDGTQPLLDESGQPVTRWDGITKKRHPVTGEDVPDESAQVPVLKYVNPRKATWPKADYVVGNPPFIGGWKMRAALGDGYVETLWMTYPDIPQKADYVIYWWDKAANLLATETTKRFGFISTNSITQHFQGRVLQSHLNHGIRIVFAIPNHPWVDATDGAQVRVAMSVATKTDEPGVLLTVKEEHFDEEEAARVIFSQRTGDINSQLVVGAAVAKAVALLANDNLINRGVCVFGDGFNIPKERAKELGAGAESGRQNQILRKYMNGRDLMQISRNMEIIDFFGFDEERARIEHPALYQHLLNYVKPERDQNPRESIRRLWWRFGWERPVLRDQISGLSRYIITPETARHRVFVFADKTILPDNKLTTIGLEDGLWFGFLSSRIHVLWAAAAGGRLGVGNDLVYTKSRCFDPFPFPVPTEPLQTRIRTLAEQLDGHRKARQAEHPALTLTGMYNVLAKLRTGEALTDKERVIHEQGLISVLKQIHDELDAAVFDAYGWPHDLTDEEILTRLVDLNHERAEEEKRGLIRWLRPEFQNPGGPQPATPTQTNYLPTEDEEEPEDEAEPAKGKGKTKAKAKTKAEPKRPWPSSMAEQTQAVRAALAANPAGLTPEQLASQFQKANRQRVSDLLETLTVLGQARALGNVFVLNG